MEIEKTDTEKLISQLKRGKEFYYNKRLSCRLEVDVVNGVIERYRLTYNSNGVVIIGCGTTLDSASASLANDWRWYVDTCFKNDILIQ